MKKDNLVDKIAKKSFESSAIQNSWLLHCKTFGPILLPAFKEDYKSKIHLCSALNLISNHKLKETLKKLSELKEKCITDEDKACWLFFTGLCYEIAGMKDEMLDFYMEATAYHHKFYMPYAKVAKTAHTDGVFDIAKIYYDLAINCFDETSLISNDNLILASLYSNYASCLTMMHRYDAAHDALNNSKRIMHEVPGRDVAEIILYAAQENKNMVLELLNIMQFNEIPYYDVTKEMAESILNHKHPHFNIVNLDEEQIIYFWNWFSQNENDFVQLILDEDYHVFITMIHEKLTEIFTFMKRDLDIGIFPENNFYEVTFADFYMVGLRFGYEKLIALKPDSLNKWNFVIEH